MDDKRVDHPKLLAAGLEARGLDEAAICWVAGHETDGFIPEVAVIGLCAMHGSKRWKVLAAKLVEVGRWLVSDENGMPGYYIHDYLKYNPTRAHRDEVREKKKANGKLGGLASGQARAKQNASPDGKYGANTRPVPFVKRGRGLKEPRAVEPDVPRDPEAASKMRALADDLKANRP